MTLPALTLHPKIKAAAIVLVLVLTAESAAQVLGPSLPPWVLTLSPVLPVLAGYLKTSA